MMAEINARGLIQLSQEVGNWSGKYSSNGSGNSSVLPCSNLQKEVKMSEEFYIPLIAFDSEEKARIILRELAFEVTGIVVKLNKTEWNKLYKKKVK